MKKAYSLDYSIERDIDRVAAVHDILDQLAQDPSPNDLEQMGSYILYGKDADGYNAVQRGEVTDGNKRFNSFRKTDDKLLSLDEVLDNPMADQQRLNPMTQRYIYIKKRPGIRRPRYNPDGTLKDIGDGDIPGMDIIWDSIDRLEHFIAVNEGKVPPREGDLIFEANSYRLYQLKHQLIDLRRHQYYLKDSYKPTIFFQALDHPKQQFIDWSSDATYWMTLEEWHHKVDNQLIQKYSTNLEDYKTRINPATNAVEIQWIVRRHTFDWENAAHIRALINHYESLYSYFKDKLQTYGRTLIFDFERYRAMTNLTDVRSFILDCKLHRIPYPDIAVLLHDKFNFTYNENHISEIAAREIPEKIALTVRKNNVILDTPPSQLKRCFRCGRLLPRHPLFFTKNSGRKDGFCSNCKDCERLRRIERGEQSTHDRRNKDTQMP